MGHQHFWNDGIKRIKLGAKEIGAMLGAWKIGKSKIFFNAFLNCCSSNWGKQNTYFSLNKIYFLIFKY